MKRLMSLFFLMCSLCSCMENLHEFHVDSGAYDRIDCPVSFQFRGLLDVAEFQHLQLVEIKGDSQIPVALQFDSSNRKLWFVLNGFSPKNTQRHFALISEEKSINIQQINIIKEYGGLKLLSEERPILNYQFEMAYPPDSVDKKFGKSGFVHPIYSPEGEVLTRIHPSDHYHHYGLWGPWTRTRIADRTVDFWNLGDKQGTVLFKHFLNETQGDVFSGFTALQEHIDLGANTKNQVALNEELEVRAWNISSDNDHWLIDYTSSIENPLDLDIVFEAYRYGGGIGFRATEKWHKDNCTVLTSEGHDRSTADGSSGKWVIVEGASETKAGRSGILFMGFPDNKAFPEPMRVWPTDANEGRGDMFFEFCPIRHDPWEIKSKNKYNLKYRLLVFDGTMTSEEAEIHWQGFANPPRITQSEN